MKPCILKASDTWKTNTITLKEFKIIFHIWISQSLVKSAYLLTIVQFPKPWNINWHWNLHFSVPLSFLWGGNSTSQTLCDRQEFRCDLTLNLEIVFSQESMHTHSWCCWWCSCVCLHTCGGPCICMYVCGDPRLIPGIPYATPLSLSWKGLSVNPELTYSCNLASSLVLGVLCICFPSDVIKSGPPSVWVLGSQLWSPCFHWKCILCWAISPAPPVKL